MIVRGGEIMSENCDFMKIMLKAQESAGQAVLTLEKSRNADKFPQMMPTEWHKERTYINALVREALEEYHKALKEAFEKQGLQFPNF
jgi:hypothetical protein